MFPSLGGLIMTFMLPPWKEKATRKHPIAPPILEPLFEELLEGRLVLGWRRRQNWPYKVRDSCRSVVEPRVKEHAVAGPIRYPERCQDLWCGGTGSHRTEHWVSKPRDICQIAQYSCSTWWQQFSGIRTFSCCIFVSNSEFQNALESSTCHVS